MWWCCMNVLLQDSEGLLVASAAVAHPLLKPFNGFDVVRENV